MALDTFTDRNKRTDVPMDVEFTRGGPWRVAGRAWYRYSRTVRKTYTYVGLSKAGASACLAAKRRQYLRKFPRWRMDANGWHFDCPGVRSFTYSISDADCDYVQVAKFDVSRNGAAPSFNVRIQVDETTNLYSTRNIDPRTAAGAAAAGELFNRRDLSYARDFTYDE